MGNAEHLFGGEWTEQKLEALLYYLRFYTVALARKPGAGWAFETWYIDAFAGTGERTVSVDDGLFAEHRNGPVAVQLDGSAKRALAVQPPFQRVVLIEADRKRFEALRCLEVDPRVRCINGDANAEIQKLLASEEWKKPRSGKGLIRGVVFLDPYGMQVSWQTLEALAETGRVDVWYLFPTEAVGRQLAHKLAAVDQWKQDRLDAVLGGPEWRTDFYKPVEIDGGLFFASETQIRREGNRKDIEAYARERLARLFPYVSEPLPLGAGNQQKFSLFLLVANDSERAIGLAKKVVGDLLKAQRLKASHRKSGL